jgi:hypothetical protein
LGAFVELRVSLKKRANYLCQRVLCSVLCGALNILADPLRNHSRDVRLSSIASSVAFGSAALGNGGGTSLCCSSPLLASHARRIERDYEESKSELGLAHFDGRGWRGFRHHASLCIAAYEMTQ